VNRYLRSSRSVSARRAALLLSVIGTLVFIIACTTFPPGAGGGILYEEIDEIISSPPLNQVNWGIRIVDPERGRVLYSRHAHLKFVPASNMKLISTAAALSLLGPEFRYQTDLFGVGSFDEGRGVLRGDLLLMPSGDPTFSERFFPSAEAPLDSLAKGLWAEGVRTVTGALVVDVSHWDSTSVPSSWMVGNLPTTSGATGGAFSIAEGVLTVEVTAGVEEGAPAQARWWPYLDDQFISVGYVTVPADSSTRGRQVGYHPESKRLRVQGRIEAGTVDTIRISQRDPVRLASAALLHALERRGIQVRGGLRIAWDSGDPVGPEECTTGWQVKGPGGAQDDASPIPQERLVRPQSTEVPPTCPDATRLATITSQPLSEIAKAILEPSQNWMTEQLVKTLGMESGEGGSWREGFRVKEEFLIRDVGVDSLDFAFRDGSGLSSQNLITPRAVVRILEYMRESSNSEIFKEALAGPGEENSTLQRRLTGLEGRVFAKTGTITHVNSLSGYVLTNTRRELIFSILTNGSGLPSSAVREGIDSLTAVLARH
jgi:D-alanyl-D-alanine carboxypeptidase/D-alanyl-D-alanine-endopeptidase (penicillin-binding protein 4)